MFYPTNMDLIITRFVFFLYRIKGLIQVTISNILNAHFLLILVYNDNYKCTHYLNVIPNTT